MEHADQRAEILSRNFPNCAEQIQAALECFSNEGEDCSKVAADELFCITATFCPQETEVFVECVKDDPDSEELPQKCAELYNHLQTCLSEKTEEHTLSVE